MSTEEFKPFIHVDIKTYLDERNVDNLDQAATMADDYALIHKKGRKERSVLFNDALNTFYLRLYGVRHMVKDHSDSEKGNPLPPHRLLLSINSNGRTKR